MADLDHQLQRLLRAARADASATEEAPPLGFASRVLAGWRTGPDSAGAALALLPLYRHAVWWSCSAALVALALSVADLKALRELASGQGTGLRLTNSAVRLAIP